MAVLYLNEIADISFIYRLWHTVSCAICLQRSFTQKREQAEKRKVAKVETHRQHHQIQAVRATDHIKIYRILCISIFVDSDHGHDKVTGRSITGIIAFIGCTPVYWCSKRQTSVQTSTFGAEFTALKKAVELAVEL